MGEMISVWCQCLETDFTIQKKDEKTQWGMPAYGLDFAGAKLIIALSLQPILSWGIVFMADVLPTLTLKAKGQNFKKKKVWFL